MKPEAWRKVSALSSALQMGESGLEDVPDLLAQVLADELWREFPRPRGGPARHEDFTAFVTTPPTEGLGASVELIKRLVAGHEVEADLKRVLDGEQPLADYGTNRHTPRGDIVTSSERGNAEDYTRRRLARDHPDLYAQVLDGDLSANAAAIQAGFRRPTATVRLDDPARTAATLREKLTPQHRRQLAALLLED